MPRPACCWRAVLAVTTAGALLAPPLVLSGAATGLAPLPPLTSGLAAGAAAAAGAALPAAARPGASAAPSTRPSTEPSSEPSRTPSAAPSSPAGRSSAPSSAVPGAELPLPRLPALPAPDASTTLADVAALTGADRLHAAGVTGRGVDVALIDSGIAPVAGLRGDGQVVHGPDLSLDPEQAAGLDAHGHGTHLAGVLAGRGGPAGDGMAPGARLVDVKVGAADGAVDVSQVIAALDWVVEHRHDDGLDIRVVTLAFGTDSRQDPAVDPLVHAVDRAWRAGLVVVTAVGNDSADDRRVASPASNPNVLAVGATDSAGSRDPDESAPASFSSVGSSRRPDLLAPGARVVSLRTPGSWLDSRYPQSRRGEALTRASGTSQSTAVVSGAVALLLQQRPELTPDQVKQLLLDSAAPLRAGAVVGSRQLDVAAAARAAVPARVQRLVTTSGTGSLEAARGTRHVRIGGEVLRGEVDVLGRPFDAATWAGLSGGTWSGGTWSGGTWSGGTWSGGTWSGGTWSGGTWTGGTWSGGTWSGGTWSGGTWTGGTWSGGTWSGGTWSGGTWSGGTWS